ncbi:MAG: TIGR04372 family glycosyltransferase [Alphaproteobacteria bacterium]|nr:TIGR04372 family glycosyltransferase [Alphaproteobacteria bacterium]
MLSRIVYPVLARLLWLLRVRFLCLTSPNRIGHLAIEPDCHAKDRLLAGRWELTVLLLRPADVANPRLLEHWRKYFIVVSRPTPFRLLTPFLSFDFLRLYPLRCVVAIDDTATAYDTYRRWGERPPLLALTATERAAGRATLEKMGVPAGAWFVCIHSREGGYSPADEHLHSYRNSSIDDYIPAMHAIVAAGGWCIRMGDSTMRPLRPVPGVIDYALSPYKDAAMDVYLCAECRFVLGNSSGLYMLAAVFGKPSALANQAPLSAVYGVGIRDIAIPKRLRRDGQLLPLGPLLRSPIANYRFTELYEKDRLEPVNNTPAEILAMTEEMLERVSGSPTYTADDEARQEKFRALFARGHYSFGAASRIGRDFLRNLAESDFRPA